jgi:hypothetical protein
LVLTGGAPGLTYSWSGPGGFTSALQSPTISNATVSASGTYTLNVTNGNGCTASAQTTVTVNPKPITSPITHN